MHINRNSVDRKDAYKEMRTTYAIEISFGVPYKLEISQGWRSWYQVVARGEDWGEKIPYQRIKNSTVSQDGIEIVNGRDGGGTFWIIGISSEEERVSDIPNLDCFGMSIDDYYVAEFLSEFLYKYFDPSIQERYEDQDTGFDWYGGNLYTFENMHHMISDIRQTVALLQENYDNPALEHIKEHWSYHRYTNKYSSELTAEEINELRKNAVPIAVDFYERFCSRMENMLKIPGNDLISFAGP